MNKHFSISLISVIFCCSYIYPQSLSNSTWIVYDTTSTFYVYFHFGNDTLSYSNDNISYSNVSTYYENGSSFSIVDLSGSACSDTGHYSFQIQSDSLKFTLVNDPCTLDFRDIVFSEFHWIRLPVGIYDINREASVKMYPNPTMGLLTIPIDGEKNILISNSFGQIIKTIKTDKRIISLSTLNTGVYFVRVFNIESKLLSRQKIIYEK